MDRSMRTRIIATVASGPAVFLLVAAHAQFFKPFNVSTRKLFARNSIPTMGYSMAFDSARAIGTDSLYHHFGAFNDTSTVEDPNCVGWGSPYCYRAILPVWSGSLFLTDNAGTYWFRTLLGDSLRFDLDTVAGSPILFYEDPVQRFLFVKSGPDTMTVLGQLDSIYTYTILHTDTNGLPVPSALDQQPIIIGQALGLIRFFQVDSFPTVLRPLHLFGNKDPDLGIHEITMASLHDHQPGDIVQIRTYSGDVLPPGQPFSFRKNSFLSRVDTPDSVIYDVAWESFNISGSSTSSGYVVQKYSKHEVLAEIPFERFNGAINTFRLTATPACPLPIWRLGHDDMTGIGPCPFGNCWIALDTQGPPPSSSGALHLGIDSSHYFYQEEYTSPWWQYYFDLRQIVYFKKDGSECGTEAHVGMEGYGPSVFVGVAPVPSEGVFVITAPRPVQCVQVMDSNGRMVLEVLPGTTRTNLDLSRSPTGAYLLRIQLQDETVIHRHVVMVR